MPRGFYVDPPELTVRDGKHYIEACGQCGGWHPAGYTGDCRSDANRYAGYDDYAERNHVAEDDVVEAEDGEP